jgi:hypothetical protein
MRRQPRQPAYGTETGYGVSRPAASGSRPCTAEPAQRPRNDQSRQDYDRSFPTRSPSPMGFRPPSQQKSSRSERAREGYRLESSRDDSRRYYSEPVEPVEPVREHRYSRHPSDSSHRLEGTQRRPSTRSSRPKEEPPQRSSSRRQPETNQVSRRESQASGKHQLQPVRQSDGSVLVPLGSGRHRRGSRSRTREEYGRR